jgi:anti-sigma factor RsiW
MTAWAWFTGRFRTWRIEIEARFSRPGQPHGMKHCRHVVELIMSYLDDTLDPVERRAFEAHIADCRNCWRFLRSYRATIALGQRLRDEDIPSDVRERLESFLRNRLQRPS